MKIIILGAKVVFMNALVIGLTAIMLSEDYKVNLRDAIFSEISESGEEFSYRPNDFRKNYPSLMFLILIRLACAKFCTG
jgi:hypothetical protein